MVLIKVSCIIILVNSKRKQTIRLLNMYTYELFMLIILRLCIYF